MQTNQQWSFVTNFDKKKATHIKACCAIANIGKDQYFIDEKALDMFGNSIPDTYALYILPETYKNSKNLFDISYQLQQTYKTLLLNTGAITKEFAESHICYLGIEKELGLNITPQQLFEA